MKCYLFYIVIFSLVASGCETKYDKVKSHFWKHGEGSSVGDFLVFTDTLYVVDHELNIYKMGKKVAKIITVRNHDMIIQTSDEKQGRYINKGDIKKLLHK